MKKLIFTLSFLTIGVLLISCSVNDYDNTRPVAPTGVQVINGDNRVDIYWNKNREADLAGYNVYYSYSYDGKYTRIGSTTDTYFIDDEAVNGNTYYYAVTAYDYNGNESDLSLDVIYSTPRPQGSDVIGEYSVNPSQSGFSFFSYAPVAYYDSTADFFFENYQGTYYLDVWEFSDIQDMGPTSDIYDIPYAPSSGWVPLILGDNIKYVEAIVGHTYVIWTFDNYYAKVRITNITADRLVFDWAFQTVRGETQLKTSAKERPSKRITYKTLVR